jgi:hypothetical protein
MDINLDEYTLFNFLSYMNITVDESLTPIPPASARTPQRLPMEQRPPLVPQPPLKPQWMKPTPWMVLQAPGRPQL